MTQRQVSADAESSGSVFPATESVGSETRGSDQQQDQAVRLRNGRGLELNDMRPTVLGSARGRRVAGPYEFSVQAASRKMRIRRLVVPVRSRVQAVVDDVDEKVAALVGKGSGKRDHRSKGIDTTSRLKVTGLDGPLPAPDFHNIRAHVVRKSGTHRTRRICCGAQADAVTVHCLGRDVVEHVAVEPEGQAGEQVADG